MDSDCTHKILTSTVFYQWKLRNCDAFFPPAREETEIIEGEVVEIQIDRPATGTVNHKVDTIQRVDYILKIHLIVSLALKLTRVRS